MRVLRRPMFRSGGSSGEGITSGLAPRQGYFRGLKVSEIGDLTLGEMEEIAKQRAAVDKKQDMYDFMIDFGLGMVGGTPAGNIFATAAQQAKKPFDTLQAKKLARSKLESDAFTELFAGAAKVTGAAKEGKGWLEQWKLEQIPILDRRIAELTDKEKAGTITKDERLELGSAKKQLRNIVSINPLIEGYIKNEYMVPDEMKRLFQEDLELPEEKRKYKTPKDSALEIDAIKNLEERYGLATGGRVGYQQGLSVQPQQVSMQPQQVSMQPQMEQAETMPEELTGITYEELRRRLPTEVNDEIVRLLVSSAEAMEDFAMIQTEEDVANFNQKYSVELVLPSEV
jgi:hypothetical protein